MYLRLETGVAGHNFAYSPGDIVDWPNKAEAERLVARGAADEVPEEMLKQAVFASGRAMRRHRGAPEKAMR